MLQAASCSANFAGDSILKNQEINVDKMRFT